MRIVFPAGVTNLPLGKIEIPAVSMTQYSFPDGTESVVIVLDWLKTELATMISKAKKSVRNINDSFKKERNLDKFRFKIQIHLGILMRKLLLFIVQSMVGYLNHPNLDAALQLPGLFHLKIVPKVGKYNVRVLCCYSGWQDLE
jgi:hypothetical protein